jgi:hypothetical protein
MEVLDNTVTVTLAPSTNYTIRMIDQNDLDTFVTTGTSNSQGKLIIPLPEKYTKYDGWFALEIALSNGSIVYLDTVSSVRPLVNIPTIVDYMKGKVNTDQAIEYESVARHLIQSIVGFDFTFVHKQLHVVGNGTDFIVTDDRILKVYNISENNVVVWNDGEEFAYQPWVTLRGIVRSGGTDYDNRSETSYTYRPALSRYGSSITWNDPYSTAQFHSGWDYVFEVDAGWPVIPQDIQTAALILINDIACGNNRYYNKYISGVRGALNISYFPQVIAGTGNLFVDNVLSKYVLESIRAKVI